MEIEILPTTRTSPAWKMVEDVEVLLTRCARAVFDVAVDVNILDAQMFADEVRRECPNRTPANTSKR
jgi:hypothetical protein